MFSSNLPNRTRRASAMRGKIIIGVDFGTTFSSVAYAHTDEPRALSLLTSWDEGGDDTVDQVPTVLRYDNDEISSPYTWGYRAQSFIHHNEKIHEWFKLGLCDDFEKRRARESELPRLYESKTAKPIVKGEACEKLVVDYLSGIKRAVDKNLSTDSLVAKTPRRYVVTVPALWDYAEQEKTRACAERAGMGKGSDIILIPESEAAGIWAIQSLMNIQKGDTFVVCDAGGGTVDLTSFTVKSLSPEQGQYELAGAGAGTGGLCGSMFLNRIFESYLDKKLADCRSWDSDSMADALDVFESKIKRSFTGSGKEPLSIRIPGLKESPQHGIYHKNFLSLTVEELRHHVFDKVISKIEALVRDQIIHADGKVKTVVLAGGFGKNPYLKSRLELLDCVKQQQIAVFAFADSATAIVKGAVAAALVGLGRASANPAATPTTIPAAPTASIPDGSFNFIPRKIGIVSRKAGRHYGTWAFDEFQDGDPIAKREIRDGEAKIARMNWFVRMNDDIADDEPKYYAFEKIAKVIPGQPPHEACQIIIHIFVCEKRDPPSYKSDPSTFLLLLYSPQTTTTLSPYRMLIAFALLREDAWEITNFSLDLEGLKIPIETRDGGRTWRYKAKFEIEMVLKATSLSFCGVYGRGTSNERRCPARQVNFQ